MRQRLRMLVSPEVGRLLAKVACSRQVSASAVVKQAQAVLKRYKKRKLN